MKSTLCLLAALAIAAQFAVAAPAHAAAVDPKVFAALDQQLHRGEWEAARTAALARIWNDRTTLLPELLAASVARLALAEAGAGRTADAIWHWQMAQNLDRGVLSADALRSFGAAGELLAQHPLRQAGAAPAGTALSDAEAKTAPRRQLEGETRPLSAPVAALPAPKYLEVEIAITAEGTVLEPVVIAGGVPGMIWEIVEGLRDWRYEPAAATSGAAIALGELTFNPPSNKPLRAVAAWSPALDEVDALLRQQEWKKAAKRADKLWDSELDRDDADPARLAAALTLRALAEAGTGEPEAVCRWQEAQHLDAKLFDADLSPYGAAGQLLANHRWGTARTEGGSDPDGSTLRRATPVKAPSIAQRYPVSGSVLLAAIVDRQGRPFQPTILWTAPLVSDEEADTAVRERRPDPRRLSWLMAVSALDRLCESTFRPQPLAYRDVMLLPFSSRREGRYPSAPTVVGAPIALGSAAPSEDPPH